MTVAECPYLKTHMTCSVTSMRLHLFLLCFCIPGPRLAPTQVSSCHFVSAMHSSVNQCYQQFFQLSNNYVMDAVEGVQILIQKTVAANVLGITLDSGLDLFDSC